jgi:hypothetical protein
MILESVNKIIGKHQRISSEATYVKQEPVAILTAEKKEATKNASAICRFM